MRATGADGLRDTLNTAHALDDAVSRAGSATSLVYRCQRETDDDRACRRADTIRRRLGWEPGIVNSNGLKPNGMQWRTCERL